jgi:hypothetical protein
MISLRRRTPPVRPAVDPRLFREAMSRPAVTREFFFPLDQGWWDDGRFTLGRQGGVAGTALRGVRLQEPQPGGANPPPERDTQNDLCALFGSVTELRRVPEFSGMVLSREARIGSQSGTVPGKRVVFGLGCVNGGRFQAEPAAAGECHRVVCRAVEKAGYRVEHPKEPFNPANGFKGLNDWAAAVRLRRKPDPRKLLWLLLLLPLLLLPRACRSGPASTPPPDTMFGVPVEADSFIILLDKSASMGPYITQVRDEARKLLQERSRDPNKSHFADLIVYDAETESVLGDVHPVTSERIAKVTNYLSTMKAGGWTRLAVATDLAAREVVRHGRNTTLIVLTDGEDKTIPQMIRDKDKIRAKFGGVPFTMHAITPRLFAPGADPRPATPEENDLAELCKCFNGHFGPVGAVP